MASLGSISNALTLTGAAAGVLGYQTEVQPYLSQAQQFVAQQEKVAEKPAPQQNQNPAVSPVTPGGKGAPTASQSQLGAEHPLPTWVKVAGYAALGLVGLFVGSRIIKG